jgi:hypothetical protein
MTWGYIPVMGEVNFFENQKRGDHLGSLHALSTIILKCILKKELVSMWAS